MRTFRLLSPFLLLGLILCSCGDDPVGVPVLEHQTFDLVNAYRVEQGLAELAWSDVIADPCRIHSTDMASGAVGFGHDGFETRIAIIDESITFSYAAENVANNQGYADPAQQAFESWLNSPPHLANMLADNDLSGMGVAKNEQGTYYFTQIFIQLPPDQR